MLNLPPENMMVLVVSSVWAQISEIIRVHRRTGLPRKVRVPEDPRTAAQVLHAVAKDMKRYKVEDLARLVCISHHEV